mmetsp:Transcript_17703/g.22508  ORF Transcript_17703/g.22508 Transcript_17703/m.22508 type:complete len:85 (+) Transcript_17703:140-394(+)
MGCMINGIEPSPTLVGSHFDKITGNVIGLRETARRDALTSIFIIAPGIMTLANDCHTSVSKVAATIACCCLLGFEGVVVEDCCC